MTAPLPSSPIPPKSSDLEAWAVAINKALSQFSDKDWNYSRLSLVLVEISQLTYPYVLMIDWLDVAGRVGEAQFKTVLGEVTWGGRHSHELGILELISLRLNKALTEVTSADYWHGIRPIVRLTKRADLVQKGQTHAFWYAVKEVQGEEFENR